MLNPFNWLFGPSLESIVSGLSSMVKKLEDHAEVKYQEEQLWQSHAENAILRAREVRVIADKAKAIAGNVRRLLDLS